MKTKPYSWEKQDHMTNILFTATFQDPHIGSTVKNSEHQGLIRCWLQYVASACLTPRRLQTALIEWRSGSGAIVSDVRGAQLDCN